MYKIIGTDGNEYGPITAEQLRQWLREQRINAQTRVQIDGSADWHTLAELPEFRATTAVLPPPLPAPASAPAQGRSGIAALIPYKNTPALVGYYLGVFSIIPCLGAPMGFTAVGLGIAGLRKAKHHPEAKGKAHAWVAIIAGGFFGLLYAVLGIIWLVAMIKHSK